MIDKRLIVTLFCVLFFLKVSAQSSKSEGITFFKEIVSRAPESVFKMFLDAGMEPTNHELTPEEQLKVEQAFLILPPLHQKILSKHLQSISFMDNMPNTALTSTLEMVDSVKQFNITFRAGILHETISEWATWKEKSAFNFTANPTMDIQIDGGKLDAIQYVLLHEATHVVDAVLGLTPNTGKQDSLVIHTAFTKNIWHLFNTPNAQFKNPLLEKTRFRSGKVLPIISAPDIYKALKKTPFLSLYGMASWYEDAAELITIYHLTQKLGQPFIIYVKENNKVIATFESMKHKQVKKRIKKLDFLYR
ncbi:MAG TPA: hypothetical protein PLY70_16120 [Saprospiraceae bacterium]|nr:hypothetical protein [Saprospiraceae bacterium]HPN71678.1 hypothetical protein [Saprospiraceae bacterium]